MLLEMVGRGCWGWYIVFRKRDGKTTERSSEDLLVQVEACDNRTTLEQVMNDVNAGVGELNAQGDSQLKWSTQRST